MLEDSKKGSGPLLLLHLMVTFHNHFVFRHLSTRLEHLPLVPALASLTLAVVVPFCPKHFQDLAGLYHTRCSTLADVCLV